MSINPDEKLIMELEGLRERFNKTTDKIIRDINRQKKIMERSDKRQRQEYDEIQKRVAEVEALNREIEETQREVVFTMGAIGESRSKETGNHVKRVAEYSKLFALYYGVDPDQAELLKQASPMHDIGKVAIPDSILNKPGRLDDEELEVMRTHAQLGHEMLAYSTRPLLKLAATVALEHHEKWDGSGYPRGLKGKDIHIAGRITALADVFDALGSDRCYKKAWDDERIFALFREERGRHFDPDLIDIFFEHIDEFLEIREQLKDDY
ncbi:HD domain-containing protein [Marinobacterium sp. D7]|uniref:HD-GYP domain-containing protein n=1 Tax=Marinobacterium ramblicola TaxID=2849041 RepID=UPI001C2DA740|nr:HD domain-containing phosphohydrolase [Marinobacterium ramblicola]MBV1786845.1 HD domain-containing protein [Marinobacterium ramblicola]